MMQIENEVGLLGDSRDRSAAADAEFSKPVPAELSSYLRSNGARLLPTPLAAAGKAGGSWPEVFGAGTKADEAFMAWNYARYVNRVAAAGKAEYNLPTVDRAANGQGAR